jgi:hypothetical protein
MLLYRLLHKCTIRFYKIARRLLWTEHVAWMLETRDECSILVEKLQQQLGTLRIWENNIKIKICCEDERMKLTQDNVQWQHWY